MEGLPVAGEDGHLRIAESGRIIQRAALQDDDSGSARGARRQVLAAITAEFSRHRIAEVRAPIGLRLARRIAEPALWDSETHVRAAPRDVLALTTMALRVEYRFR